MAPTLTVVLKKAWVQPSYSISTASGSCRLVSILNDPAILATDIVLVTGQSVLDGGYLRWSATVDDGAIQLHVCNFKKMTLDAQYALHTTGRVVNIVVLR